MTVGRLGSTWDDDLGLGLVFSALLVIPLVHSDGFIIFNTYITRD